MLGKEEVLEVIDEAFRDAKLPRTDEELAYGCMDGLNARAHFRGKTRRDVDASWFSPGLHMEDFSYMTPMAVEYYLPCALRLMLEDTDDYDMWLFLFGFLRPNRKRKLGVALERLSDNQKKAISVWAGYLYTVWEEQPCDYIDSEEARFLEEAYERGNCSN